MALEVCFSSPRPTSFGAMVSTRSRAAEVPTIPFTAEMGDAGPSSDISCILEAQARMQQEFTEYKKRNADEMEALREENCRLKRKIEADKAMRGPRPNPSRVELPTATKEESKYKPTSHTTGGNYSSFASRRTRRLSFVDGIIETPLPHNWKASTV